MGRWRPDVISGDSTALVLLGQAAFVIGYIGFWRLYGPRLAEYGRSGRWALGLFCSGGTLLAVGHLVFLESFLRALPPAESLFLLVLVGLLLMVVGLIWLGILNVRRPWFNGWRWLPLTTAVTGFSGFFLSGALEARAPFLFLRTLFALGLFAMGVAMALEARILATSAEVSVGATKL